MPKLHAFKSYKSSLFFIKDENHKFWSTNKLLIILALLDYFLNITYFLYMLVLNLFLIIFSLLEDRIIKFFIPYNMHKYCIVYSFLNLQ